MISKKWCDVRCQNFCGDRIRCGDAAPADESDVRVLEPSDAFRVARHHRGEGYELLALRGGRASAILCLEQGYAEILLQARQAACHGCLVDPQPGTRSRETSGFVDRGCDAQVIPIHTFSIARPCKIATSPREITACMQDASCVPAADRAFGPQVPPGSTITDGKSK